MRLACAEMLDYMYDQSEILLKRLQMSFKTKSIVFTIAMATLVPLQITWE